MRRDQHRRQTCDCRLLNEDRMTNAKNCRREPGHLPTAGISLTAEITGRPDFRAAIVEIGNIRSSELSCGLPGTFPQGLWFKLGIVEEKAVKGRFGWNSL